MSLSDVFLIEAILVEAVYATRADNAAALAHYSRVFPRDAAPRVFRSIVDHVVSNVSMEDASALGRLSLLKLWKISGHQPPPPADVFNIIVGLYFAHRFALIEWWRDSGIPFDTQYANDIPRPFAALLDLRVKPEHHGEVPGDTEAARVAPMIASGKLTHVEITNMRITERGAETLRVAFSSPNQAVSSISFAGSAVQGPWLPEGLEHLDLSKGVLDVSDPDSDTFGFLRHLPSTLKNLNLASHNDSRLPPAGITSLALAVPPQLERLNLFRAQWSMAAAESLASAYPATLRSLTLGGNALGKDIDTALVSLLPPSLLELNLAEADLSHRAILALAKALPPTLEILNLGGINLGSRGAGKLASVLPPTLRALHLFLYGLSESDIALLAKHFPPSLRLLALEAVDPVHDGLATFAQQLPAALEDLRLTNVMVGDTAVSPFLAQVPRGIKRLDLSMTSITGATLAQLVELELDSLERVQVGYCGIHANDPRVTRFNARYPACTLTR
ncbi:hypothetical protein H9P43_007297 [Blastocladiella emersonii ATCC 22665]|nr:hypothetical protein H9P43_007297 [Blastocladiella emersonii ATCC 22665]